MHSLKSFNSQFIANTVSAIPICCKCNKLFISRTMPWILVTFQKISKVWQADCNKQSVSDIGLCLPFYNKSTKKTGSCRKRLSVPGTNSTDASQPFYRARRDVLFFTSWPTAWHFHSKPFQFTTTM